LRSDPAQPFESIRFGFLTQVMLHDSLFESEPESEVDSEPFFFETGFDETEYSHLSIETALCDARHAWQASPDSAFVDGTS
jgi:hypothetical protein